MSRRVRECCGVVWVCGLWCVLGRSGSLRPQRLCVCGLGCRVLLFSAQCAVCSVQCAVCSVQCWRPAVARRWSVVCASVVFGLRQSSIFFNLTRSCSRSTKWCGPQSHNAKLELQPQHVRSTSGCSVFRVPCAFVFVSSSASCDSGDNDKPGCAHKCCDVDTVHVPRTQKLSGSQLWRWV